jgi:hypothetical protein
MRRSTLVGWTALAVGLMICPLLAGCFVPLGAAWPSVAVTPSMLVNADPDQVRAFRVDVEDNHAVIDFNEPSVYTLQEVPVLAGGWIAPQANVACDYGWYWNCIALSYWKSKHHTVMMRLYRPGCQTVEVPAWTLPQNVQWRGIADLAGQEKAVDDLVSIGTSEFPVGMKDPTGHDFVFRRLATGEESDEHRKALLFAASEYLRLAKTAPDDADSRAIRDRMQQKAAALRQLAGAWML